MAGETGKGFPEEVIIELKTEGRGGIKWQNGEWKRTCNTDGQACAKVLWPIGITDKRSAWLKCKGYCEIKLVVEIRYHDKSFGLYNRGE